MRPNNTFHTFTSVLAFLALAVATAAALPAQEQPAEVIATTGWTAAFARMAGAESLRVLAPYEMRHPPEYELKPSDIQAVAAARLIIFAGYETMVKKLKSAAGNEQVEMLQIDTRNDLNTVRALVQKIAAALGTEQEAARNLAALEAFFQSWKAELEALGLAAAPVLVHFHQRPLAAELGFSVQGVFGPGPLEPAQLVELAQKEVRLIVDNWHNEIAAPLEETIPEAVRISFINFPGAFSTRSLMDVLEHNRRELARAVEEQR